MLYLYTYTQLFSAGLEQRPLHKLGKLSTNELHPQFCRTTYYHVLLAYIVSFCFFMGFIITLPP